MKCVQLLPFKIEYRKDRIQTPFYYSVLSLFLLLAVFFLFPQENRAARMEDGASSANISSVEISAEEVENVEEIIERFAPSEEKSVSRNKSEIRKRLVVNALLEESYDAREMYWISENHQTVLEYESIQEAKKHYEELSLEYDCFLDEYISADVLDSCLSWGAQPMHFEELKEQDTEDFPKTPVTVAVLDTGIDVGHSIFQNRISQKSRNFTMNDGDLSDQYGEGHGTHISGILADLTPENVEILCCKIFNSNGASSRLIVSTAFLYAIHQGADLINFSASWENESEDGFLDSILEEADLAEIPVCVAAGNESQNVAKVYPANRYSVVTVGALNDEKELADYSNTGKYIDFVAPGTEIESARAGCKSKTTTMTGTSMAAPHITAALAYVRSFHPEYSKNELIDVLKKSSIDLGSPGWDASYGWGMPDMQDWLAGEKSRDHLHSYGREGIPATCTQEGRWVFRCKDPACGNVVERKMPCLGHHWKTQVSRGGEEEIILTCNLCGQEQVLPTQGICGDSMYYQASWSYSSTYDESVCHLEFRGTGAMYEYGEGKFPWSSYIDRVRSISMDYGIRSIADYAFKGSCNLTDENLHLPSNLENIGKEAFADAMRLQTISIGDQVKTIGEGAFSSCRHLKGFLVGEEQPYYSSDGIALYDKKQEKLYACATADSVEEAINCLKLPETVREIGEKAFAGNRNLNRLDLPVGITKIAADAFAGDQLEIIYHCKEDSWLKLTRENYGGKIKWVYEGERIPLAESEIRMAEGPFSYKDHAVTPEVALIYHGETLVEGKDYTVSYENAETPGQACLILQGIGFFQGRESLPYTIEKGQIEVKERTELLEEGLLYTGIGTSTELPWELHVAGTEITPEHARIQYEVEKEEILSVTEDGYLLGKNAGETLLTLHILEGNYEACSRSVRVQVTEGFTAKLQETVYYYTEKPICPDVKVYNSKGEEMVRSEDYQLSYEENVEPGIAYAVIQGIHPYRGRVKVPFRIRKRVYSMEGITFVGQTWTYDGQEHSLEIQGNLPEGVKVTYQGNEEKEAGRYTVTARFTGDTLHESIPSKKATMVIEPADLSGKEARLDFGDQEKIQFTANDIKPNVVLTGLTEDDYSVQYQDNFEPGQATVIIEGCGNYCGEIFLHFQIQSNELWVEYEQMQKDDLENNQPSAGTKEDEDPPGNSDSADWGDEDPEEEEEDHGDSDHEDSDYDNSIPEDNGEESEGVSGNTSNVPILLQKPAIPKIKKIKNQSSRAAIIQWKKVSGVQGYKIQYALNPSFKGAKTIKISNARTVKRRIKKLKKGRKYYVRICSYRMAGKTMICSKWSGRKGIKIKR